MGLAESKRSDILIMLTDQNKACILSFRKTSFVFCSTLIYLACKYLF